MEYRSHSHGTTVHFSLTHVVDGAEHLEEASYVDTLQTRTADMHDCQLGSVVYYYGPDLHSHGNRQDAHTIIMVARVSLCHY